MNVPIDALTSPTLKHLRELWWDDEFTEFLAETLRPRPGTRILDVGCGTGTGEVTIGRLQVSQLRLVGIDVKADRVMTARHETAGHNQRVGFAVADVVGLPFTDGAFDSTYCVAVLQHVRDAAVAVREMARVTARRGRVVVVEPDNHARYAYCSVPAGARAFAAAEHFFATLATVRGEHADHAVGPRVSSLFASCGVEALDVRLFPVSQVKLGAQAESMWRQRRARIEQAIQQAPTDAVRRAGDQYLAELAAYEAEATQAGAAFVEIQHTMLFATVGQNAE